MLSFLSRIRFIRWLNTVEKTPGISVNKVVRLLFKAFLFAFLAVTLQALLVSLKVPYANTIYVQIGILLLIYIPFFRWMNAEMMYTRPQAVARGKDGKPLGKKLASKAKKIKYAGVKGKGPKFR